MTILLSSAPFTKAEWYSSQCYQKIEHLGYTYYYPYHCCHRGLEEFSSCLEPLVSACPELVPAVEEVWGPVLRQLHCACNGTQGEAGNQRVIKFMYI